MHDFVGEQSRVHIMPISAKWKHKSSIHIHFIVFNGGVTTFFAKSVIGCSQLLIPAMIKDICIEGTYLNIWNFWSEPVTENNEIYVHA